MAHTMTAPEWHELVSHGTRTAKLSTVRSDGGPHIAPVWFLLDGDDIVFTTSKDTVKGRNLLRDDRVALAVDDERPPYSFAVLEGRAELSEEPTVLRSWATRIAARYMGEARAEEYGARNSVPGELLVRVRLDKVIAVSELAD